MKKKVIKSALKRLEEFEEASPYDTSEIEISMDALASALSELLAEDENEVEELSLEEAIDQLPIDAKAKGQLTEIVEQLRETIERSDYDSAEDEEDTLSELKTDFYHVLEKELARWLKANSER